MIPVIGLEVFYKDHAGVIRFVDDAYCTLCVRQFREKSRDICILIYRKDFKNIHLLKQSQK